MPRGELLKKLFYSYAQGDNEAFQKVASEIIRDEESKNNRVLANSLRRNLTQARSLRFGSGGADTGPEASRKLTVIPFEREKQLPLVETVVPARRASDLIVNRTNQHLLLSLISEFRQRETLGAFFFHFLRRLPEKKIGRDGGAQDSHQHRHEIAREGEMRDKGRVQDLPPFDAREKRARHVGQ